jgi:hypothetical protein
VSPNMNKARCCIFFVGPFKILTLDYDVFLFSSEF